MFRYLILVALIVLIGLSTASSEDLLGKILGPLRGIEEYRRSLLEEINDTCRFERIRLASLKQRCLFPLFSQERRATCRKTECRSAFPSSLRFSCICFL